MWSLQDTERTYASDLEVFRDRWVSPLHRELSGVHSGGGGGAGPTADTSPVWQELGRIITDIAACSRGIVTHVASRDDGVEGVAQALLSVRVQLQAYAKFCRSYSMFMAAFESIEFHKSLGWAVDKVRAERPVRSGGRCIGPRSGTATR